MKTLETELRDLVRPFNQERIEYALCGGMAVAIHGDPRFTKDIDFLIPAEALERVKAVATMAGFLDGSVRMLDLLVPKSLETVAWQGRQWFDWNGLSICTFSVEGLVEMKRAAGRAIDLIDIEQLGFDQNEE